jgi:hypothetical protein
VLLRAILVFGAVMLGLLLLLERPVPTAIAPPDGYLDLAPAKG